MERIAISIALRTVIALGLCITLISYPQLRLSSAEAATRTAADQKSESQFRSEGARYDSAIRAVSGVNTMKLETAEDLKKALDILDREGPNLKLFFSKLVVLAGSDSTFASAVKKQIPDKQTAERFAKEWKANPRAVLKLEGAESLATRLQRSIESDAAILRRAAERLKEASEKVKKTSQGSLSPRFDRATEFIIVRVGFNAGEHAGEPDSAPNAGTSPLTPQVAEVIIAIVIISAVVGFIVAVLFATFVDIPNAPSTACLQQVEDKDNRCVAAARTLPFPLDIAAKALCKADELLGIAGCVAIGAP